MPIINPWIFYVINILNVIHIVAVLLFWTLLVLAIFIIPEIVDNNEQKDSLIRSFKIILISAVVCFIVSLICPSADVLYRMLAAKYVTKGVIIQGVGAIDGIANKIIQIIN